MENKIISDKFSMMSCKKCNFYGDISFFVKEKQMKSGYRNECKDCKSKRDKISREKHKEMVLKTRKKYYELNREKILLNKKTYNKNNREKINKYRHNRIKNDELFKFKENIRGVIKSSFRRTKNKKDTNAAKIIGCDFEYFKKYIESKFEPWMNWENYGAFSKEKRTWQLDHIIPISLSTTKEELIKLNHYTNFQPLESYYNIIKSNKYGE